MKTRVKYLTIILIAAFVGMAEVANAFYDPGLQRWINRDPLGDSGSLAYKSAASAPHSEPRGSGEVSNGQVLDAWIEVNRNLYGAMHNDPSSQMDPLGLCNYVKTAVGIANIARGVGQVAIGIPEALVGVPAIIAGPATGPLVGLEEAGAVMVTAKATYDITGGGFKIRRGIGQIAEGLPDEDKGHWRNLLGLLPFGSLYDDPGESLKDAWKDFKNMPFWQKIGEACTF